MKKKYQIIYADPPWEYKFSKPTASKGGSKGDGYSGGVNYYYGTMSIERIKNLKVDNIADKDSVLFLWATNPLLPEAFEVMGSWGFKYKTCITWNKERCKGMGYWFRGHTEHLLFGVKGKIKAFRSLTHNIKSLPVEKHSKKPEWFKQLIEEVGSDMPNKIELFAREKTPGWDVWGNEVESDITL